MVPKCFPNLAVYIYTPINTTGEFLLLNETSLVPLFQLFVVLIFTSLINKEVVHLFKCLLAIFFAILWNEFIFYTFLFKYFVYFVY